MPTLVSVKPIHSEKDHEQALKRVENLWDAQPGSPEDDEMDILISMIEHWEDEHYSIDPPDPIDAILFRMEQQDLTRKDLEIYLGGRNRVSEALNRKRPLTLRQIRALSEGLAIPAEILLREGPSRRKRSSRRTRKPRR